MRVYQNKNTTSHGETGIHSSTQQDWSRYIKDVDAALAAKKTTPKYKQTPPTGGHFHVGRDPYGALAKLQKLATKFEMDTTPGSVEMMYKILITQENLELLVSSSPASPAVENEAEFIEDQIIEYGDGLSTEFLSGLRAAVNILTRNGHLSDFVDEN